MGRTKNRRKTLNSNLHHDPSLQKLGPSSSSSSQISPHPLINKINDVNSDDRNWNDLPEPILTSIFTLLPSLADLASAASVSHQWNSAAATSACSSNNKWALQRPPLLLQPLLKSPLSRFNRSSTRWIPPPRCNLIPLVSGPTSKPYYHPVFSSQTLAKSFCVGCHSSKLILIANDSIVLHDVFTGEQIRSPKMACLRGLYINFGTLTAPVYSSSLSMVLLVARQISSRNYFIISWEPNGSGNRDGKFAIKVEIVSFVLFNNQIYYLDFLTRVGVVEFDPEVSWRLLDETVMVNLQTFHRYTPFHRYTRPKLHLVECDGELLMLLFIPNETSKMNIYKLDLVKRNWVKKDKLNNWCVFVDAVGKTGFSCKDPERWGGRSNCIYVAAPSGIYTLNNEEIDMMETGDLSLFDLDAYLPKWPSPLWVYPSQPRRNLLKSGCSGFVSSKRLIAGDAFIFLRGENDCLRVEVRGARRQHSNVSTSVISSHNMYTGVFATA